MKTFHTQFYTKDIGKLRYFMGIGVAQSKEGISLSHWKYVLNIINETGFMSSKLVDTPMKPNVKLCVNQGELMINPDSYQCLLGKLNYLTITQPDISFAISVVSHLCHFLILHTRRRL